MTNSVEVKAKSLTDIHLKTLEEEFTELLKRHLGGELNASVAKYEQTHPNYSGNGLVITFHVNDRSWAHRTLTFVNDDQVSSAPLVLG